MLKIWGKNKNIRTESFSVIIYANFCFGILSPWREVPRLKVTRKVTSFIRTYANAIQVKERDKR